VAGAARAAAEFEGSVRSTADQLISLAIGDPINWESGPRSGIMQSADAVTATGELECRVGRVTWGADDVRTLFGRIRILSQEGTGQPACSIGVAVEECCE
jgi:hypothetical protein